MKNCFRSAGFLPQSQHHCIILTCSITSGAIQHGVPTNVCRTFCLERSLPVASHADTPKSAICTVQSSHSRMLPAFTSLKHHYTLISITDTLFFIQFYNKNLPPSIAILKLSKINNKEKMRTLGIYLSKVKKNYWKIKLNKLTKHNEWYISQNLIYKLKVVYNLVTVNELIRMHVSLVAWSNCKL